jgi:hypothetical protein
MLRIRSERKNHIVEMGRLKISYIRKNKDITVEYNCGLQITNALGQKHMRKMKNEKNSSRHGRIKNK